jgi:hypothetical protein
MLCHLVGLGDGGTDVTGRDRGAFSLREGRRSPEPSR